MNGFGEGTTGMAEIGRLPVEEEMKLCLDNLRSQIYATNGTDPSC